MSDTYPDSVRIVLFDVTEGAQDGRFLLVAETDDPDNFKLPGGKFEPGETPDEASARELQEETGLQPDQVGLRKVDEAPNLHDPTSKRYIYAGSVAEASVRSQPDIATYLWVTEHTVPEGKNHEHILAALSLTRDNPSTSA